MFYVFINTCFIHFLANAAELCVYIVLFTFPNTGPGLNCEMFVCVRTGLGCNILKVMFVYKACRCLINDYITKCTFRSVLNNPTNMSLSFNHLFLCFYINSSKIPLLKPDLNSFNSFSFTCMP